MPPRLPRSSQLLALWLALIVVVSATLAVQAFRAQRSHRRVAEQAVANYAHLAATRLAERLELRFGAYTCATLAGFATQLDASSPPAASVDARALEAAVGPRVKAALAPVEAIRRVPLPVEPGGAVGAPDDSTYVRRLEAVLRDRRPDDADWGAVLRADRRFAYRLFRGGDGAASHAWIFAFARDSLSAALQDVARVSPLLPRFLLRDDGDPRWLHWRIEAPDGTVLAASPSAGAPRADFAAADTTSRTLDRCVTRVRLDPEAAKELVQGGLPGSNLPATVVLLLVAGGLLAGAYAQLRREAATARMREDFIASVSHELRTPLAQIRLFTETLKLRRVRDDEERDRALEVVDRESSRLAHLVDNVLLASRAGRGALTARRRPTDVGALVHEVAASFAPLAAVRSARVTVEAAADLQASVDPDLLRQALLNLLDNAVKYGPAGQAVALSVDVDGANVRFRVDDAGPGIPRPERERVWDRFFRLERDRGAPVAGSGLGLAVVRDVVRLHDGTVAIDDAPGGGARVEVRLPR